MRCSPLSNEDGNERCLSGWMGKMEQKFEGTAKINESQSFHIPIFMVFCADGGRKNMKSRMAFQCDSIMG